MGAIRSGERECVFCGFKWFPLNETEPCPYHDGLHRPKSAAETAILDNSQTKPHYSAKVILWVGGLVFLAMATGLAVVFMGAGR